MYCKGKFVTVMERACIRVAIFDTVVRIAVEIDINAYGFIRFPSLKAMSAGCFAKALLAYATI